jgi:hypothetical protein
VQILQSEQVSKTHLCPKSKLLNPTGTSVFSKTEFIFLPIDFSKLTLVN